MSGCLVLLESDHIREIDCADGLLPNMVIANMATLGMAHELVVSAFLRPTSATLLLYVLPRFLLSVQLK